jgi:carbon starvation protein
VEGWLPKKAVPAKKKVSWGLNIGCGLAVSAAWGYLLYNNDISTIWPMFGIANQLLAAIALAVGTTLILQLAPKKIYALTTIIPFVFVFITTMVAGVESIPALLKIAPTDPAYKGLLNAGLTIAMLALTVIITADAVRSWIVALRQPSSTGSAAVPAAEEATV